LERMRAPLEQLLAEQALECDHVAGQGALRDEQRVRCRREAAVLGDALEGAQRIERQPASIDRRIGHATPPAHCSEYLPRLRGGFRCLFSITVFNFSALRNTASMEASAP